MFGINSPLSSTFWSSPTKPNINMNPRVKKEGNASIDLKRLSIFALEDAHALSPTSNNSNIQKENIMTENKNFNRDELISQLMKEMKNKDAIIADMQAKLSKSPEAVRARKHRLSQLKTHIIHDNGRMDAKVARSGSLMTTKVFEAITDPTKTGAEIIAENLIKVFQKPEDHLIYMQSKDFANHIITLCDSVGDVFEDEPKCLELQSPTYVIGDIHGNLEDLHFFSDNLWKLGMDLSAGKFLFLGDYVDRGLSSIECVAYLFGLKLLYPNKIFMLRGNHETRDVNGWEEHYGEKSFIYQCKERFGTELGEEVWEKCNRVFDRLPLSCVIDKEIFCVHGGIPRQVSNEVSQLESIKSVPVVSGIMPSYDYETDEMRQVCTDCLWSDPACDDDPNVELDMDGYGDSVRGGGAVCFGNVAVDNFLKSNNLAYIIRAHEAHAHGVSLSKAARVFTVFSTSKDHRQGGRAMAGCILIDEDKIQVINRSASYKNRYVHRRTSISLENLTFEEIEDRRKVGLIRDSVGTIGVDYLSQEKETYGYPDDDDDDNDDDNDDLENQGDNNHVNHVPKW